MAKLDRTADRDRSRLSPPTRCHADEHRARRAAQPGRAGARSRSTFDELALRPHHDAGLQGLIGWHALEERQAALRGRTRPADRSLPSTRPCPTILQETPMCVSPDSAGPPCVARPSLPPGFGRRGAGRRLPKQADPHHRAVSARRRHRRRRAPAGAPPAGRARSQTIVVENRPGAGGNLAMVALKQSAADGHTLAMSLTGMLSINPVIYRRPGSPLTSCRSRGLAGAAAAGRAGGIAVEERAGTAGRRQGSRQGRPALRFGRCGRLVAPGLRIDQRARAGGNFMHVPYKGGAPLVQALMANEVKWGLLGTGDARSFVQSGKLRAIGAAAQRPLRAVARHPDADRAGREGRRGLRRVVRRGRAGQDAATGGGSC